MDLDTEDAEIYAIYQAKGGTADTATFKSMVDRFFDLTLKPYVYGEGNRRLAYNKWEKHCLSLDRLDDAARIFKSVDQWNAYT